MSKKIHICTRKDEKDIKCFDNSDYSGDLKEFFALKKVEGDVQDAFVCSKRYCKRRRFGKKCCKKIKTQKKTADTKVSGGRRKYIRKNKTKKGKSYKKKYNH